MTENAHMTPYHTKLTTALRTLAHTLLGLPIKNEQDMIKHLLAASDEPISGGDAFYIGCLRQVERPKAMMTSDQVMGGGTSYALELITNTGLVGLTLLTNFDRITDGMNRFVEIVPVYVVKNNSVHWFHEALTPVLDYQLTRHLYDIDYRLDPTERGLPDPFVRRLNLYRSMLIDHYGYTEDQIERIVRSCSSKSQAVSFLRDIANGQFGAHVGPTQ